MSLSRARRDTSPAWPVYVPREGIDRVPVFHASGECSHRLPNGVVGDVLHTRCGIVVYRYVAGDVCARVERTRLRLDHAEAIGTPCARCWPLEQVS